MLEEQIDSDVTIHSVDGALEREDILHLRARLRGNSEFRRKILGGVMAILESEGIRLNETTGHQLTLALDVELNDEDGHVIT